MAGLPNSANTLAQWHRLFEAHGATRSTQAHEHLQQLLREGLPGRKSENWKYTPLNSLLERTFVEPVRMPVDEDVVQRLALPVDALKLVFVDGVFDAGLSDDTRDSAFEIEVNDRRDTLPPAVQPETFLHLTESLAQSVTHIRVKRNQQPAKPLLLMHLSSGRDGDEIATAHYRHHLVLESGAQATVYEHYVSLDAGRHFTGSRLTIQVGANSQLHHYKLAFENPVCHHFAHNDLLLEQNASVLSSSFLLGGAVLRHHTSTQLNGENATLRVNSLALPVNNEVCDSRTWLEHNKGYCNSRQLHKVIARDRGKAVFNGLIKVAQHAIKTDGQMTNNNLLLGRLSEVDTKPQLEIYADDVKCSHGATVGRIDDEQMFYLRSRGIDQRAAEKMIVFAFAAELTESVTDTRLKQQVLARIEARLGGES